MNRASAYSKTQAETASKERLMVMLFEAALRHIRTGAIAIEQGRATEAVTPLMKANDIVVELRSTLDVAKSPELCGHLADLYLFVCTKLMHASVARDAVAAREAERAFAPVVEAFQMAVAGLKSQPTAVAR